ncbi:MAG: hypothetical protein NWQ07_04610 [Flaviramulus sp.]|nr:hypothetical protein [Flaviramulus sp.]
MTTCLMVSSVFSQTSLNDYKYVIVPKKFDFLKEQDEYQLNSLANFLFNKYGFETIFEGDNYPQDFLNDRCLALKSDVLKDSGVFKTKLTVVLKDCFDKVVYTSKLGESREKEFKTAYNLALRDAFESFRAMNYQYKPNQNINTLAIGENINKSEVANQIQLLKQEIQELKKENEFEAVVVESVLKTKTKQEAILVNSPDTFVIEGATNILYAQEIENGFQLVDSTPKVVYRIKKTNLKDLYLVDKSYAIVYKKNEVWLLEYYSGNDLNQEILNIKF